MNITGQEGHTVRIGPFAFLTALSGRSESGDRASQTARRHRKVTALPLRHGEDRHPADVVADVAHRWSSLVYAEHMSWWIVYLNMLGSLLFALSLAGSFLLTDGSALAPRIAILSTFAGAMCFFIAAYLLIPESQEKAGDSNK
ncbi:MAG TPA: hypothetical protein EYQ14_27150 [Gammaproteobacteria bacterium]|nr:hypothetical protein [Gammaproteobacteria bacterium]